MLKKLTALSLLLAASATNANDQSIETSNSKLLGHKKSWNSPVNILKQNSDGSIKLELNSASTQENVDIEGPLKAALDKFIQTGDYNYPISPGGSLWGKLNSRQMAKVAELPDEVILNASTAKLVSLMQNHPNAANVLAYNSAEEGFAKVFGKTKLLKELKNRPDFDDNLISTYLNSADEADAFSGKSLRKSKSFKDSLITSALSQEDIVERIKNNPKLLRKIAKKLERRASKSERYTKLNVEATEKLANKILTENLYLGKKKSAHSGIADKLLRKISSTNKLSHKQYLKWLSSLAEENAKNLEGTK